MVTWSFVFTKLIFMSMPWEDMFQWAQLLFYLYILMVCYHSVCDTKHINLQALFCILVIEELKATGKFELMDLQVDEAEHSMEMHLPYLAKVFHG